MRRTTEEIKAQHAAARAEMDELGIEPYYLGVIGALDWLLGVADTSPITATPGLAVTDASLYAEYEAEAALITRPEHLRPGGSSDGWLNAAAEVLGWVLGLNAAPMDDGVERLRPDAELASELDRLVEAALSSAPNDRFAIDGAMSALRWLLGRAPAPLTTLPAYAAPSVDDVVRQLELLEDQRKAFNRGSNVEWGPNQVGVEKALNWALDDLDQSVAI